MTAVRSVVSFLRSPEYVETDVDDRLLEYLKRVGFELVQKFSHDE